MELSEKDSRNLQGIKTRLSYIALALWAIVCTLLVAALLGAIEVFFTVRDAIR